MMTNFISALFRRPVLPELSRLLAPALAAILLLQGCNTTPQRPTLPPAPKPIAELEPPPAPLTPPELKPDPSAQDTAPASQPPAEYAAPSANAAVVEMEEVVVGQTTDAAPRPQSEVLAEMNDSREQRETAASGGGAPVPAGGQSGGGAEVSGASGQAISTAVATDASLDAPNMQIGGAQTGAPLTGADRTLAAKLAKFDALMRNAQAAAEQERAALGPTGHPQGNAAGRGQRLDQPPQDRGAGGAGATASGLGNTPDLIGQTSGNPQPSPLLAETPADLGSDDDIVARQLREAATKERDAVLRDKLWAEYRKYKAGL